jgi:hypothetical protein
VGAKPDGVFAGLDALHLEADERFSGDGLEVGCELAEFGAAG